MNPIITQRPARYGATAMALHWGLGLAIVAMLGMGWYMTGLPFSPQRLKLYNWHKWAGMAVLALSILRMAWRLIKRPPALPADMRSAMPRWQQWLHHGAHHLRRHGFAHAHGMGDDQVVLQFFVQRTPGLHRTRQFVTQRMRTQQLVGIAAEAGRNTIDGLFAPHLLREEFSSAGNRLQ